MSLTEEYLIAFLEDEFRLYPEVRIRRFREDNEEGVSVKTESREYFFPLQWVRDRNFKKVQETVEQIKAGLPDR